MPVITALQRQQRAVNRYSVYLDNKYGFSLSDLELSRSGLWIGQELDVTEVQMWEQRSLEGKVYNAAVSYIMRRPRSRYEMEDYLRRRHYESALIERVIERLQGSNFINDEAFAEAWVRYRQSLRPRSYRMLEAELLQKGVDRNVISAVLRNLGEAGEVMMLVELIQKKRRQTRYQDPDVLLQYLARQGFGYEAIKKALARLDDLLSNDQPIR